MAAKKKPTAKRMPSVTIDRKITVELGRTRIVWDGEFPDSFDVVVGSDSFDLERASVEDCVEALSKVLEVTRG